MNYETAVNKVRQLDKEQLLKVIRDSGYNDIANIFNKQDINGKVFVDIREIEILNWKCSRMDIKKVISFIKEFRNNPSILLVTSPNNFVAPSRTRTQITSKSIEKHLPWNPESKMKKSASLENIDFPIKQKTKKGIYLPLPTNDSNRHIKSLNDLSHDIRDQHNYKSDYLHNGYMDFHQENLSTKTLKRDNVRNVQTQPLNHYDFHMTEFTTVAKSRINRSFQQIPQKFRRSSLVPEIDIRGYEEDSDFSSDDEDVAIYVNVPKIKFVNDQDDPDNIYENLNAPSHSSNTKIKNNIPPISVGLRSTVQKRCNLEDIPVHIQTSFNSSTASRKISGSTFPNSRQPFRKISENNECDYPSTRDSNKIFDRISTIKANLESQKNSMMKDSHYDNNYGNSLSRKIYNEHIYENIDDIFLMDRNIGDLIVRHHKERIFNDHESDSEFYDFDNEPFFRYVDTNEAIEILENQPDGAFIFTPSDSFVFLTVKYMNTFYSFPLEYTEQQTIIFSPEISEHMAKVLEFKSLTGFANYYMEQPIVYEYDDVEVNVKLKPVIDLEETNELGVRLSKSLQLMQNNNTENNSPALTAIQNADKTSTPDDIDAEDGSPVYSNPYEYSDNQETLSNEYVRNNESESIYENIERYRKIGESTQEGETLDLNSERFFRNTDRKGAKLLLQHLPDGAFLFRPSDRYFLVLTIKFGDELCNLGIKQTPGKRLLPDVGIEKYCPEFDSLNAFVNYFTNNYIGFKHNGENLEVCLNPVLPPDTF